MELDSNGNAFWPLQLGTWRIEADDGKHRDRVTIRVIRPRAAAQPGFTYVSRAPLLSGAQRKAMSKPSADNASAMHTTNETP